MIGKYHIVKSDAFRDQPGEDAQGERSGRAFAEWIASELRARGELVTGIISETFGCRVMVRNELCNLWIECGQRRENVSEWGAYVVADPSLIQRLFSRVNVWREVDRLSGVLEQIAQSAPKQGAGR